MSDFLDSMAAASAERERPSSVSARSDSPVALRRHGFDIIAELKSRSPSAGKLAKDDFDRVEQARCYASAGACAISVLTEPTRFDGSLAHLEEVAAAVPDIPVMRKDFLVHPWQVAEARSAGASGVLLIAAMLDAQTLQSMIETAAEQQLFVLLEAFDRDDLAAIRQALASEPASSMAGAGQLLVGVNARDLRTLGIDANRLQDMAGDLPDAVCVAESGMQTAGDIAAAANAGYSMALVGGALMQSDDPGALVREFLEAGREKVAA